MFGAEFDEAVRIAVTPSDADIMRARQLIIELLTASVSMTAHDFDTAWATAHDLPEVVERQVRAERAAPGQWAPPSRNEPYLTILRGHEAFRYAIAELLADGVVVWSAGDLYNELESTTVSFVYSGGGNPVSIELGSPRLEPGGSRWQLSRRATTATTAGHWELLGRDDFLEGLEPLLGSRGRQCLVEAHAAYRHRLWLAAANLLASASEAAWYALGRAVAVQGSALAKAIDDDNTVTVVNRTCERLRELKARPGAVNEVRAHADYLRDVRNYGLHPRELHDADREGPFTEAGCTALFMASRRYFVKLLDLKDRCKSDGTPSAPGEAG